MFNINLPKFLDLKKESFLLVENDIDNFVHVSFKTSEGRIISFEKGGSKDGLFICDNEEEYIKYILLNNEVQTNLSVDHELKNIDKILYDIEFRRNGKGQTEAQIEIKNPYERGKYELVLGFSSSLISILELEEGVSINILKDPNKKARVDCLKRILDKEMKLI